MDLAARGFGRALTRRLLGRRALSLVLLGALLIFAFVNAVALVKLQRIDDRMEVNVEESVIWAATQAETELLRLIATARAADPDASGDLTEIRRRFDIFWSRLAVFDGGVLAEWLAQEPERRRIVEALRAGLVTLDPAVRSLPADPEATLARLLARLEPAAAGLRRLAVQSVHEDRRQQARLRRLYDQQRLALMASAVGFAGTATALFAFLFANVARIRGLLHEAELARREAVEARNSLEAAIENVEEGFVLFDGGDRLVLCNEKYKDLYGPLSDVIRPGAHFVDIARAGAERGIFPEAHGRVDDWIVERLERRRHGGAAYEQPLTDGRWLLVSDRPTRDAGTVGIRADVTELKRREFALEEARAALDRQAAHMATLARRAEEASAAKSDFLAMMSHEIRTPMNGVLGALGLLADHVRGGEPERLLVTARQSGEALLNLLNDILDLSKAEAGRLALEPSTFDPTALVESVVDLGAIQARAKALELRFERDDGVPPRVTGDACRVRQMLMNLVSNAVKFTEHGEVRVRLGPAPAGDRQALRFEVIDEGVGIPADRQADVFDDFVQLEPGTSGRQPGTGLGLAITRRLAELMGGHVGFVSVEGAGSRFWFDVPLTPAPVERVPATPASPGVAAPFTWRPRLLVAEDNGSNQVITRAMLERLNARVDVVADGAEAVSAAADRPYDAAILDLSMPVMGGEEAARRLRAAGFAGAIVAATANADQRRAARLKAGDFDAVLVKPLDRALLRRTLADGFAAAASDAGERAAPPSAGDVAWDDRVLAALRADVDAPTLRGIFTGAAADLEAAGAAWWAALAAGEDGGARRAAHRIAGVAASVGAAGLAKLARGAETDGVAIPAEASAALGEALVAATARLQALGDAAAA